MNQHMSMVIHWIWSLGRIVVPLCTMCMSPILCYTTICGGFQKTTHRCKTFKPAITNSSVLHPSGETMEELVKDYNDGLWSLLLICIPITTLKSCH